jgi:hypothetical protein
MSAQQADARQPAQPKPRPLRLARTGLAARLKAYSTRSSSSAASLDEELGRDPRCRATMRDLISGVVARLAEAARDCRVRGRVSGGQKEIVRIGEQDEVRRPPRIGSERPNNLVVAAGDRIETVEGARFPLELARDRIALNPGCRRSKCRGHRRTVRSPAVLLVVVAIRAEHNGTGRLVEE